MVYYGYKFVKFFVELPTFDCKICLFSPKIIPFYCPKTKFKHTLRYAFLSSASRKPMFSVPSLWSEIVHSIALHHSVIYVPCTMKCGWMALINYHTK